PSIIRFCWSGLTRIPRSPTVVTSVTRTLPVFGLTATLAAQAQTADARLIWLHPWPTSSPAAFFAFGFGDGRVTHPDLSRAIFSTLITRGSVVLSRRNWIGSAFAAAASSLIIDS